MLLVLREIKLKIILKVFCILSWWYLTHVHVSVSNMTYAKCKEEDERVVKCLTCEHGDLSSSLKTQVRYKPKMLKAGHNGLHLWFYSWRHRDG